MIALPSWLAPVLFMLLIFGDWALAQKNEVPFLIGKKRLRHEIESVDDPSFHFHVLDESHNQTRSSLDAQASLDEETPRDQNDDITELSIRIMARNDDNHQLLSLLIARHQGLNLDSDPLLTSILNTFEALNQLLLYGLKQLNHQHINRSPLQPISVHFLSLLDHLTRNQAVLDEYHPIRSPVDEQSPLAASVGDDSLIDQEALRLLTEIQGIYHAIDDAYTKYVVLDPTDRDERINRVKRLKEDLINNTDDICNLISQSIDACGLLPIDQDQMMAFLVKLAPIFKKIWDIKSNLTQTP